MSIILYQFAMKMMNAVLKITDPFSSTVESEFFLNLDFGVFHAQFFLTDFQKYNIILKWEKPVGNSFSCREKQDFLLEIP